MNIRKLSLIFVIFMFVVIVIAEKTEPMSEEIELNEGGDSTSVCDNPNNNFTLHRVAPTGDLLVRVGFDDTPYSVSGNYWYLLHGNDENIKAKVLETEPESEPGALDGSARIGIRCEDFCITNLDCAWDEYCDVFSHECKKIECYDTDSGINVVVSGTCTDAFNSYEDSCVGEGGIGVPPSTIAVNEWFCEQNTCLMIEELCPQGTECVNGACRSPE